MFDGRDRIFDIFKPAVAGVDEDDTCLRCALDDSVDIDRFVFKEPHGIVLANEIGDHVGLKLRVVELLIGLQPKA